MSKTRKILSLLVAVVMVFGVFSVCALAAGNDVKADSDTTHTQEWALSEPQKNSDGSWSVDVTLKTNYPTGAIQFVVTNADGNATLKSATLGAAVPAAYNATISKNATKGKVMITPQTSNVSVLAGEAVNGVIATLTYTVADGKQATIAIANSPKIVDNVDGTLLAAYCKDLVSSDMLIGQTVTSTGVSRTLGESAKPELVVKEGTNGVIDTTRTALVTEDESTYTVDGLLYGVETSKDVDDGTNNVDQTIADVFEVKNGTMNIVKNDANSSCGTGTKVQVLDKSGNVVATYVLVIFGDINGDGRINSIDANFAELHDIGYYPDGDDGDGEITDTVKLFAADVNADGRVNPTDSNMMSLSDIGYYPDGDDGDGVMSQFEIMEKLSQKGII